MGSLRTRIRHTHLRPEISALLEVGLLFLPSIPAYLWLWPVIPAGIPLYFVQSLVYIYVLTGVLFIGKRRWSWSELGVNRRGISLSLVCGSVLLVERLLAQAALGLPLNLRPFDLGRVAVEVIFYFALVGVVEELLFRGLLFRALENLRGPGLAVFGSSLTFALWHLGWAGPLAVAHFLIGLLFGLIRWRAGGIVGLIFIHGLYDLLAVEMQTPFQVNTVDQLLQVVIANRTAVIVGDVLLFALVLYLWVGYSLFQQGFRRKAG